VELDLPLITGGGIQIIDMVDGNNGWYTCYLECCNGEEFKGKIDKRYGKVYLYLVGDDLVAHFDGEVSGVTFDFYADETKVPHSLQATAVDAPKASPVVVLKNGAKAFDEQLFVYIKASGYKWYTPLPFIPKNITN